MRSVIVVLCASVLFGCSKPAPPVPEPAPPAAVVDAGAPAAPTATLAVENRTDAGATFFATFGADSEIHASDWSAVCAVPDGGSVCAAPMPAGARWDLPTSGALGRYLNATIAVGATGPGCSAGGGRGATVAEMTLNRPGTISDTGDVSLVDGYSDKLEVFVLFAGDSSAMLGPPRGSTGNESVYGVFPLGCDWCVQRGDPPCGQKPCALYGCGCKTSGTQFNPGVPCQGSFARGGRWTVALVP
jgi:hypothetical protein